MKNFEKYKTAKERHVAFKRYCGGQDCKECKIREFRFGMYCSFVWLELEAEEEKTKPMDCPFCGGKCVALGGFGGAKWLIGCVDNNCLYTSSRATTEDDAISKHNRLCSVINVAKKGEMK